MSTPAYRRAVAELRRDYERVAADWRNYTLGRVASVEPSGQVRIDLDTKEPRMALEPPHNPYAANDRARDGAEMQVGRHGPAIDSRDHDRAQGLTGELLDELLRRRWSEGFDTGKPEGYSEGAADVAREHGAMSDALKPHIYTEGWRAGLSDGHGLDAQRFGERIHALHEIAHNLATLDGLGPEVLREALDVFDHVLSGIIHEHNGGVDGPTSPRPADPEFTTKADAIEREQDDAERAARYQRAHVFGRLAWLKGYCPAEEDRDEPEPAREPEPDHAGPDRPTRPGAARVEDVGDR